MAFIVRIYARSCECQICGLSFEKCDDMAHLRFLRLTDVALQRCSAVTIRCVTNNFTCTGLRKEATNYERPMLLLIQETLPFARVTYLKHFRERRNSAVRDEDLTGKMGLVEPDR